MLIHKITVIKSIYVTNNKTFFVMKENKKHYIP